MIVSKKPILPLSELVDRLDAVRDELLVLQRSLEDMERAELDKRDRPPNGSQGSKSV